MPKRNEFFNNMVALAFIPFLLFSLGCGELGFDKDVDNDDSLEEAVDVQKAYQAIEGVYEGEIIEVDEGKFSTLPIEISLFTEISFSGRANGELKPQTTLQGFFKYQTISTPSNYHVFEGRYYYRGNGKIQLAVSGVDSEASGADTGGKGRWLEARIVGDQIVGGTLYNYGTKGTFTARRITNKVQVPAKGRAESDRRRFNQVYGATMGKYRGFIIPPNRTDLKCDQSFLEMNIERPNGEWSRLERRQFDFYSIRGLLRGTFSQVSGSDSPRMFQATEYRANSGYLTIESSLELSDKGGTRGFGYLVGVGNLKDGLLHLTELETNKGLLGSFCGRKD